MVGDPIKMEDGRLFYQVEKIVGHWTGTYYIQDRWLSNDPYKDADPIKNNAAGSLIVNLQILLGVKADGVCGDKNSDTMKAYQALVRQSPSKAKVKVAVAAASAASAATKRPDWLLRLIGGS